MKKIKISSNSVNFAIKTGFKRLNNSVINEKLHF